MGFSRQEYWSGSLCPSPRDLPNPGIEPRNQIYVSYVFCIGRCVLYHQCHLESLGYSIQFSCSVTSDSLWLHGLQHARPSCPSPTSGVYSDSCPLSSWCNLTILSSVIPFSHLQSFPASGSFQMSQFASGGQSMLDLLAVQGTLMSLLQHQNSKASTLWRSAFFIVQLSHPYMTTGKTIALTRQTFCWQGNVSAFYMLGPNKCKIESRSLIWILVLVKGWSICLNIIHVFLDFMRHCW